MDGDRSNERFRTDATGHGRYRAWNGSTPKIAVDRHGPVWAAYGSEGWDFESLRARSLPATMFSLPESDTAAAKRLPALASPQCAIRWAAWSSSSGRIRPGETDRRCQVATLPSGP